MSLLEESTVPFSSPWPDDEVVRFLETYSYSPRAFLVSEVLESDPDAGRITARMDTNRFLPLSSEQRGDPVLHPRHVSGPDQLMLTANLGALHAYFFHRCHWDAGWVGFGSRVHRADFQGLAHIGPPLELVSQERRVRVQSGRVVLRWDFEFSQGGRQVYTGDQSGIFVLNKELS